MKTLTPSALKDLAKVKAIFQARTLEMLLKDQPKESPRNTQVTPTTPERTPT